MMARWVKSSDWQRRPYPAAAGVASLRTNGASAPAGLPRIVSHRSARPRLCR
jgi:hypothetical protein